MDIKFQEYDGSFYAYSPSIVREADQLMMKLDEKDCTHILIFSCAPGQKADLSEPELQAHLRKKAEILLEAENERISENVTVRCISYRDFRMNNCSIELPGRIAEYTVYGCRLLRRQEPETLYVCLPQKHMRSSAIVAVTISYRIEYCSGNDGKYAGRQRTRPYYAVQFEEAADYQDGGIVYSLENIPFLFPITKDMLDQKRLYIDAGMGVPKFQTTVPGLNLKKL